MGGGGAGNNFKERTFTDWWSCCNRPTSETPLGIISNNMGLKASLPGVHITLGTLSLQIVREDVCSDGSPWV